MTSFRPGFTPATPAYAEAAQATATPQPDAPTRPVQAPKRAPALRRRYEIAAMMPDGDLEFRTITAPAADLFEACASGFARGTLVPTSRGPMAIEDLIPGDLIATDKGYEPVTWIGSTTYLPGVCEMQSSLTRLTRITAEAYGPAKPTMDVLVGPAARMTVRHPCLERLIGQDAVLAPVIDYADGDRLIEIVPGGPVQLYHLMTHRHGLIDIGGIAMETYHPGPAVARALEAGQRPLFLSLFPHLSQLEEFGEVTLTRTTRQVIENLIAR
ncbi:Hint domain-containing protein [Cognatishimia sp. F0-27]|uniref:Hint domain-containing protein n=1 Tax=Cognatishimia sp. F0-27 TaxID=2816855 RepID=UPI001D0C0A3E|nr:Hint domain-containing protein [Cognatishimia sp. F0-27]MCC1491311.1 Hint domain-containing protein [Cognatishimia sp. F0-27]